MNKLKVWYNKDVKINDKGGIFMENLEEKKQTVILDPETAFEFEVARNLKKFLDDREMFYHIEVLDDLLSIRKEGYNTPPLDSIEFDMSQLIEDDLINHKFEAIREAYAYTFAKTRDLMSRVATLENKPFADSHDGASHAFYHDRTGKYPESEIAATFIKKQVNDENFGMHR